MDEGLSIAVREVFVRLYDEGLIYRGERLINWCPRCRTALSDIEVEHEDIKGKLYFIEYPLDQDPTILLPSRRPRPETMLGDTAMAVHPDDPDINRLDRQTSPSASDDAHDSDRRRCHSGGPRIRNRGRKDHAGARFQRLGSRRTPWSCRDLHSSTIRPYSILQDARTPASNRPSSKPCSASCHQGTAHDRRAPERRELLHESRRPQDGDRKCYRCKTVVEPYLSPSGSSNQAAGRARDRGGRRRTYPHDSRKLDEQLFRMDGKY